MQDSAEDGFTTSALLSVHGIILYVKMGLVF